MGLLDSLFDPSTYSGQQGGLLSLLQSPLFQASAQPSQGFPPVQQGASFADRFNALPNAPQPVNPSGRQFDAATFDPSTYAPNQAQPIGVGGYQMPRLGSADLFQSQVPTDVSAQSRQPDPAALPPNSQPTQGGPLPGVQSQQAQLPPALGGNPFGGAGLQNFLNTPGGLLQKVVGGIGGAVTGQRTDPLGMQQQNLKAQYDSLVPIVGPQKALLAVMNPEAGKTILTEALTNKTEFKTMKDALGQEHGYFVNPYTQKMSSADGGSGGGAGTVQVLAPGVKQYDPSLTGDQYLAQFGPEVQASIKSWLNGDVMPTGNPRVQSINTAAKTFAQKYAQDMGIPFSDATYSAKRKMQTDLGSSSNSSMGGILSNGDSALHHLAEAGTSMVAQGNVSYNFPLGGKIAHAQNYVGNTLGGSDTLGKVAAINKNLEHFGQEGTKFYAGNGGGEGERMAALREFNANSTSSEEQAAFLEKEKSLMVDRLNSKLDQIRQTMGPEEAGRIIAAKMPQYEASMKQIDDSIAKLRSGKTGGSQPASTGPDRAAIETELRKRGLLK